LVHNNRTAVINSQIYYILKIIVILKILTIYRNIIDFFRDFQISEFYAHKIPAQCS